MPGVVLLSVAVAVVAVAGVDRLLAALAVRQAMRRVGALAAAGRVAGGPVAGGRVAGGRAAGGGSPAGPGSAPAVRIAGMPFLTQLAAGVYREVEVSLDAVTAGGIEFRAVTARLSQVRAPLRLLLAGRGLVAGQVSALATIPFAALTGRLPPGFVVRRHGTELGVFGSALLVPVTGTLAIGADRQRISVTPKVLGVPSLVAFVIALPGLPPELTIDSLRVTDVGLEVSVRGENVNLTPP